MIPLTKPLIILIALIKFVTNMHEYMEDTSSEMLEAGKIQFQLIQERGSLPQYGSCWLAAIHTIEDGCRHLTEETQRDIALHLTNCFLELSQHATYECIADKKPNLRRICLNSMSDRAFNVYTEFYTHTQNMCWFLRGQIWREEMMKSAHDMARKMAASTKRQDELLRQQNVTLTVQRDMLRYATELNGILSDFYAASRKHQDLLSAVTLAVVNMQNWLIGEVSWFDSVVFYASVSFLVMFFTSTKRTINARFVLLVLLAAAILCERILCYKSQINDLGDNIFQKNKSYYEFVWILRYFFVILAVVVLLIYSLTFKDYLIENNALILQLRDKIDEFMEKSDEKSARKSILNIESGNVSADKNLRAISGDFVDVREKSLSRQLTPFSEVSFESNVSRYNLRSRLASPNIIFKENARN